MIILLDVSPSTDAHGTLGDILGYATALLEQDEIKDADGGVIAFGSTGVDVSDGFQYMGLPNNRLVLTEKISLLNPNEESETSLDQGLITAKEMLENEDGILDLIIISDGGIEDSYEASLNVGETKERSFHLH